MKWPAPRLRVWRWRRTLHAWRPTPSPSRQSCRCKHLHLRAHMLIKEHSDSTYSQAHSRRGSNRVSPCMWHPPRLSAPGSDRLQENLKFIISCRAILSFQICGTSGEAPGQAARHVMLPPWPRNTALECFVARGFWALSGHSLTVLSWLPLATTHLPPTCAGLTGYIIVPGRNYDCLWTKLATVETVSGQQILR